MKHLNKCHKCGLVNGRGEHVCRSCGGMLRMGVGSVGQSLAQPAERAPRYLFLMPFLILALGLAYWSSQIKKSAIAATQVDQEQWHRPTMAKKVSSSEPPVDEKPRNLMEGVKLPPFVPFKPINPFQNPNYSPSIQPTPPPDQPTFSTAR